MRIKAVVAAVFVLLCAFAIVGNATENGGGAYPNGAEGFYAGAVPPPGNYFINYFLFYAAGELKDKDGHKVPLDFDLAVTADVLRFIHISDKKILGGFWGCHVFIPLVNMDVSVAGTNENRFGLGDIIVDPFILSWHSKNFHSVAALDIYCPTGLYDKTHLANPGRNYWTFEPIYAFTLVSDGNFEVSCKLMYDFNTENDDTDYASGQEFHADYLVGQKFKNTTVGIGGYYYQQITDDKQGGVKVGSDGNKGTAFAIGPQVKFDAGNKSFILAYDKEMWVKNRPEGQSLWFKFVCPF